MSLMQFDLGGYMEPLEQLVLQPRSLPVAELSLVTTLEVPAQDVVEPVLAVPGSLESLFLADPTWQSVIDESLAERHKANHLSDWRAEKAPVIGGMILLCEQQASARRAAASVLAYAWHTDRRDGQHARRSVKLLEKMIEEVPGAAEHPQVKELLSLEMSAVGGRKDEQADKALTDAVNEALLERALEAGDMAAVSILSATDLTTRQSRNPRMERLRQFGRRHNVSVGAKSLGKAKTAMLAVGQGAMVLGKTAGHLNRFGLGLIAASNAPSWGAIPQMGRHIKQQIAAQQPVQDWIKAAPNERTKFMRLMDEEGEPLPASIAA
ncbi:MAG: hypothetical protein ABI221_03165 [Candidatus Saccharimonadales bacterium]